MPRQNRILRVRRSFLPLRCRTLQQKEEARREQDGMKKSLAWRDKKSLAVAAAIILVSSVGYAQIAQSDITYQRDWSPVSVAIVPAVEFPFEDWDVSGVRIAVFAGKHHDVGGIDVGTIANIATGDATGLQTCGIFARTYDTLTGCQVSPISLAGTLEGIQIGVFNRAEGLWGLQVGVVNYAYQANGVQLGLINIIADSELPILPVVNIGF